MEEGGWIIDVTHVKGAPETESFAAGCMSSPFWAYSYCGAIGKVRTVFQGHGEGKIDFGNCFHHGTTNVFLSGALIG